MKTTVYNPSALEVELASALVNLQRDIEEHLPGHQITHVENQLVKDNPIVRFSVVDNDGDTHEIVVRIIQMPDKY